MAMQVKHMLTVGLGLGVVTALGYHFLSTPQYSASTEGNAQLKPLSRFELAPTPPAISDLAPIPSQPQVDNQFRTEATPLRSSTFSQAAPVEPSASYEDLASAAQDLFPAAAEQGIAETSDIGPKDSVDGFSLDLSSPATSEEPEFAFEELEQTDIQPPSLPELEPSLTENQQEVIAAQEVKLQEVESFGQTAGKMSSEESLAASSTQVIGSQSQEESLAVVVDFQSQPIKRSGDKQQKPKKNIWKGNPFINNVPVASVAAKLELPAPATSLELEIPEPKPVTVDQGPPASTETVALPNANSVLSLNDPIHEGLVRTIPATAIPASIQQPRLTSERLTTQPMPETPSPQLAMNSADTLKAVHHVEYGKTLSRRGAAYTARQEFLAAMQLIATANDKASGDNRHSKALRSAMLAIKEAGDFSVASSEQQIQMDVATVVESHRSRVLTVNQAANLSPVQAMNRYFASAQDQLDLAGGRNVVSAEVFYCMGKLHTLLSRTQKVLGPYETAKSVVYHQAALLSDNQHHRSSNELGVLLARSGRLEQAKLLFERSLMTQPTVRTWQNLAEAHRRLGEVDFANQAVNEVQMLASGQLPASQSNIQWMPVNQFNADAPVEFNEQRVAKLPPAPAKPLAAPAGKSTPGKSIAERIKGIF